MDRVKGKICIVTGGALGIGRACAQRLAEEGARIAIFDVLDEPANAAVAAIHARGIQAQYWHVDITSERSVAAAVAGVASHFGGIDVLVNNAGIGGGARPSPGLTEDEWDRMQAVNVQGVFLCTKHVIPHMRRARAGSIINLSSIYGLHGAPDAPPYQDCKGAVRLISKTDAMIYAADGIRVNSIHPGFVWTPMLANYLRASGVMDLALAREDLGKLHPLGQVGEPDDIAWGVVYLASSESRFMTGCELIIDGGYTTH